MKILTTITDFIKSFVEKQGKLLSSLLAILIVLITATLILLCVECSNKKAGKNPLPENSVKLDREILLPPEQNTFSNEYYFSRNASENWDNSEFEKWFTEPDDKTIEALQQTNDSLINGILGDAP